MKTRHVIEYILLLASAFVCGVGYESNREGRHRDAMYRQLQDIETNLAATHAAQAELDERLRTCGSMGSR